MTQAFHRHELGLYVPDAGEQEPSIDLPHVGTYLTYSELSGGRPMIEEALVGRLEKLSAADCMLAIAHIGTQLFARVDPAQRSEVQRELIVHVAGDGELARVLTGALDDPRWSAIFCEQQLVHLARLVLLHADLRPHDDFAAGTLYDEWVTCLVGVTDLLDADLEVEARDDRLAWELRQFALNERQDELLATAIHHEIYRILWPELGDERTEEADKAFSTATGMTIGEYFSIGSAVMARFRSEGAHDGGSPLIRPDVYFSSTELDAASWQAFFALNARDASGLRDELVQEHDKYGPTTYGSLAFERFPLMEVEPGLYLPISMRSLQRRITTGVLQILSEAAVAEGLDRRHYSSAFGPAFQALVERTVRRGEATAPSSALVSGDIEYGPRRSRRRSSDVIITYDRNPVFVEVVSGPLQAATVTRGDLDAFAADTQRLVVGKVKQLDQSIRAFLDGDLTLDCVDLALVHAVWPVVVTSHAFPHAETVLDEIERQVRAAGYLTSAKVGALAIVSAEELAYGEGFMQQGRSLLSLIRSWKAGPEASRPFKNHLIALGGGRAPVGEHFKERFEEATNDYIRRLLGSEAEQARSRA